MKVILREVNEELKKKIRGQGREIKEELENMEK